MTALLALGVLAVFGANDDMAFDATWNVMEYGADRSGEKDSTAAFQEALDAAAEAKGGVVLAPTGRYRFDGELTIPVAVTLKGVFGAVPAHAGIRDKGREKPEYGTVFEPRSGAGEEEGTPFITIQTNGVLQGVCIHYPDQKPDAEEPTPYPYAIAMRGNNPAVLDVELLNPFKGIDASRNQRHLIRNVHGQPIRLGIYVDAIYDIGRIENVHWNPWWSHKSPIFEWQMEHGVGFVFGKSDWQYVLNTFCFGYHIGYQFVPTPSGNCNGNFLGIGADNCQTSLQVDECNRYGLLITNGEFVTITGPDPTMVRVGKMNTGVVRFVNCAFWGPSNRVAVIEGTGTVGFSDCTFDMWGRHGKKTHAIEAYDGTVLVRGSDFHDNKPQVFLGGDVKRAVVTDNVMQGAVRITNEARGNVAIGNNVGTAPQDE